MTGITDEMVETALMAAMRFGSAQDDPRPVDDQYLREQMRAALTGALAGRAVVDLPEPGRREDACGVDAAYWDLKSATGFRCDWVQSYAIDGLPVVYDSPGPAGQYSVEEMRERCLAGLAACDDAERLAAEQHSSGVAGGVL